jgi:DNA polymerase-1
VLKTTEKNAEAADDQALVLLSEWCANHRPELTPLFELVQEYRRWGKLKATYIDGYLRFISPVTGRIHPDLLPWPLRRDGSRRAIQIFKIALMLRPRS